MSDSSYHKLKWDVQGVFDNVPIIEQELEKRLSQIPENHTNERKKVSNWIDQIKQINEKIQYIKKVKLNELNKNLNYKFTEPDLVILSLIQPSIKNLFEELTKYSNEVKFNIDFEYFISMSEAAKVLALIGDAAIDLAIIQILWKPNISNVGELTIKRSELVSNKNLARICDKWGLYDYRLHFDPNKSENNEEKINHVKGTIVEALFGVMYIEDGLDQIISSIIALK